MYQDLKRWEKERTVITIIIKSVVLKCTKYLGEVWKRNGRKTLGYIFKFKMFHQEAVIETIKLDRKTIEKKPRVVSEKEEI